MEYLVNVGLLLVVALLVGSIAGLLLTTFWSRDEERQVVRRRLKYAFYASLLLLIVATGPFVLDAVLVWAAYSWIYTRLASVGVPEYPAGILAIWMMAAALMVLPTVAFPTIRKHIGRSIRLAVLVTVWYSLMFVLTTPHNGGLFSPWTGAARYRCKTDNAKIVPVPIGLRFDTDTGSEIPLCTADDGRKYKQQKTSVNSADAASIRTGFFSWVGSLFSSLPEPKGEETSTPANFVHQNQFYQKYLPGLNLWIDSMHVARDRTFVNFAARGDFGGEACLAAGGYRKLRGVIQERLPEGPIYLVDVSGNTYQTSGTIASNSEAAKYDEELGNWFSFDCRTILRDQTLRFSFEFQPFPGGKVPSGGLKLHTQQFESLSIDSVATVAIDVDHSRHNHPWKKAADGHDVAMCEIGNELIVDRRAPVHYTRARDGHLAWVGLSEAELAALPPKSESQEEEAQRARSAWLTKTYNSPTPDSIQNPETDPIIRPRGSESTTPSNNESIRRMKESIPTYSNVPAPVAKPLPPPASVRENDEEPEIDVPLLNLLLWSNKSPSSSRFQNSLTLQGVLSTDSSVLLKFDFKMYGLRLMSEGQRRQAATFKVSLVDEAAKELSCDSLKLGRFDWLQQVQRVEYRCDPAPLGTRELILDLGDRFQLIRLKQISRREEQANVARPMPRPIR